MIVNIDIFISCDKKNHKNLLLTAKLFNPFKSEFTIVIFIHYKPRVAVAILDL